jgi:hypothetical protein
MGHEQATKLDTDDPLKDKNFKLFQMEPLKGEISPDCTLELDLYGPTINLNSETDAVFLGTKDTEDVFKMKLSPKANSISDFSGPGGDLLDSREQNFSPDKVNQPTLRRQVQSTKLIGNVDMTQSTQQNIEYNRRLQILKEKEFHSKSSFNSTGLKDKSLLKYKSVIDKNSNNRFTTNTLSKKASNKHLDL